jgi:carboxymethylenebutenolidase
MTVSDNHITVSTAHGLMPAFEVSPGDHPKGAIIVVQEAFGVTPHIEDVTRRLGDAGFHAVAPAFFHREGAPALAYDDFDAVMPLMGKLSADGITADLIGTLDYLDSIGFASSRVGVVGFCMGGSVAFYAGTLRPLGAAVTYYGGGIAEGRFGLPPLIEQANDLKTPWLGQFGDLDERIPAVEVESLREAAAQCGVPTEIFRYADADHGFNCNDRPAVFNQVAADQAWARTIDWFNRYIESAD